MDFICANILSDNFLPGRYFVRDITLYDGVWQTLPRMMVSDDEIGVIATANAIFLARLQSNRRFSYYIWCKGT